LAGLSSEEVNANLKKFSKTFGELRAGTGAAFTFLQKFDSGLRRTVQSARNTDHALELVMRAMGNIKDQSDKAAFATAFFGRAGIKMTVAVKDGADALENFRREAHQLGLVIDEKLLRNAEVANDRISILSRTIGTNFTAALLHAAPMIGDLA